MMSLKPMNKEELKQLEEIKSQYKSFIDDIFNTYLNEPDIQHNMFINDFVTYQFELLNYESMYQYWLGKVKPSQNIKQLEVIKNNVVPFKKK